MMRDSSGISSPRSPSGYPRPSTRSWWCRTQRACSGSPADSTISNPSIACCFMTSYSSSVSAAGLFKIASGTPILPTSCNSPARRIFASRSPVKPSSAAISALSCETVWQWLRV